MRDAIDTFASDSGIADRSDALRTLIAYAIANMPKGFIADCSQCGDRGRVILGKSGPHAAHFECACGNHKWLSKKELQAIQPSAKPAGSAAA